MCLYVWSGLFGWWSMWLRSFYTTFHRLFLPAIMQSEAVAQTSLRIQTDDTKYTPSLHTVTIKLQNHRPVGTLFRMTMTTWHFSVGECNVSMQWLPLMISVQICSLPTHRELEDNNVQLLHLHLRSQNKSVNTSRASTLNRLSRLGSFFWSSSPHSSYDRPTAAVKTSSPNIAT